MPEDDRFGEDPSESGDGTFGEGAEKTDTVINFEADKDKTETTPSETPRIANTVTEPETQEQGKGPERAYGVSGPPTNSRTVPLRRKHNPRPVISRCTGSDSLPDTCLWVLTVTTNERDLTYLLLGLLGWFGR